MKGGSVEWVIRAVLDLLALFLAANLAFEMRYNIDWGNWLASSSAPWRALYLALPYMLFGWFIIFSIFGLYRPQLSRREEFSLLIKATATTLALIFAAAFFYRDFSYSRAVAIFMGPLAFLLAVSFRLLLRAAQGSVMRWGGGGRRLLILGHTDESAKLVSRLLRADNPFELVGVLSRDESALPEGARKLGEPTDLDGVLKREPIDRVLLISAGLDRDEMMNAIEVCLLNQVDWAVVPDLYDFLLDRLHMDEVLGVPVMGPRGSNIVGMNRVVKRAVDLALAAVLLLILAPVMLLVALAVKMSSRGPVFFIQDRVGLFGRKFPLIKFRSMVVADDAVGGHQARRAMQQVINGECAALDRQGKPVYKLATDPRITSVGRVLRRFSLDELPQLFNVIHGDMSLIGPRPAVSEEVAQYRERHRRRLAAHPGITGLWQVSGRNRLTFDEMVELDLHYIENWSAGLDTRIFFKTIIAVLFSRGY